VASHEASKDPFWSGLRDGSFLSSLTLLITASPPAFAW
jgi:hypothetical protein